MHLREMDCEDGKWMGLTQNCSQWRTSILAVLNLGFCCRKSVKEIQKVRTQEQMHCNLLSHLTTKWNYNMSLNSGATNLIVEPTCLHYARISLNVTATPRHA